MTIARGHEDDHRVFPEWTDDEGCHICGFGLVSLETEIQIAVGMSQNSGFPKF